MSITTKEGKPNFKIGDRVWRPRGTDSSVGTIVDLAPSAPGEIQRAMVLWDGLDTPQPCYTQWLELATGPRSATRESQAWTDFGVIYQFGFPYPGGLYTSFQALDPQQNRVMVEIPLSRSIVAGGVFRPINHQELGILGMDPANPKAPKWTWIVPQLQFRFFIGGDLIKELLLMWSMGWEPSPGVLAELAKAAQEGEEDQERERRIWQIITQDRQGGPGGGGTVQ